MSDYSSKFPHLCTTGFSSTTDYTLPSESKDVTTPVIAYTGSITLENKQVTVQAHCSGDISSIFQTHVPPSSQPFLEASRNVDWLTLSMPREATASGSSKITPLPKDLLFSAFSNHLETTKQSEPKRFRRHIMDNKEYAKDNITIAQEYIDSLRKGDHQAVPATALENDRLFQHLSPEIPNESPNALSPRDEDKLRHVYYMFRSMPSDLLKYRTLDLVRQCEKNISAKEIEALPKSFTFEKPDRLYTCEPQMVDIKFQHSDDLNSIWNVLLTSHSLCRMTGNMEKTIARIKNTVLKEGTVTGYSYKVPLNSYYMHFARAYELMESGHFFQKSDKDFWETVYVSKTTHMLHNALSYNNSTKNGVENIIEIPKFIHFSDDFFHFVQENGHRFAADMVSDYRSGSIYHDDIDHDLVKILDVAAIEYAKHVISTMHMTISETEINGLGLHHFSKYEFIPMLLGDDFAQLTPEKAYNFIKEYQPTDPKPNKFCTIA